MLERRWPRCAFAETLPVLEHALNHPTTNKFVAWSSGWKNTQLEFDLTELEARYSKCAKGVCQYLGRRQKHDGSI